jgi:hypothetical protein
LTDEDIVDDINIDASFIDNQILMSIVVRKNRKKNEYKMLI